MVELIDFYFVVHFTLYGFGFKYLLTIGQMKIHEGTKKSRQRLIQESESRNSIFLFTSSFFIHLIHANSFRFYMNFCLSSPQNNIKSITLPISVNFYKKNKMKKKFGRSFERVRIQVRLANTTGAKEFNQR